MVLSKVIPTLLGFASVAAGQQAGTNTAETHPSLSYQNCTSAGCSTVDRAIVLDSNWRWVHNVGGSTNCYTVNTWNEDLCPDAMTCTENCALDGADYSGTYGIQASGNSLNLKLVTGSNVGSRVYLINGDQYEMFKLKNMEFTFDVDVSNLPCGVNGALYFVKMDADGGLSKYSTNKAGAKYGTGYCDAQCPQDLKFIAGKANSVGWIPSSGDPNSGTGSTGSCCSEIDVWEANSISTAFTPHPCTTNDPCDSNSTCGVGDQRYNANCDKDGCDFNGYRWGNHTFFGPGSSNTLDSESKMTVVTQFITGNNTATGTLTAIRRLYVQNGKVIQQSTTNVTGITPTNQITKDFCTEQKEATGDTDKFGSSGGLAAMGKDMDDGMVLVMSTWVDYAAQMLWLDSNYPTDSPASAVGTARSTCSTSSGVPADVISQSPNSNVIFSNIKFGTIGSTYAAE